MASTAIQGYSSPTGGGFTLPSSPVATPSPISTGLGAFNASKPAVAPTTPVVAATPTPTAAPVITPQVPNPITVSSKTFQNNVVTPAQKVVQNNPVTNPYMMGTVNVGGTPTGQTTSTTTSTPTTSAPKTTVTVTNTVDNPNGTKTDIMSDGTQKTYSITTDTNGKQIQTSLDQIGVAKTGIENALNQQQINANNATQAILNPALTDIQKQQVQALQTQWDSIIAQQRITNQAYEGGLTNLGISAGRNRYAPEVELGNITAAANQGVAKIADLTAKENQAVSQLQQALLDGNAKAIEAAYNISNGVSKERIQYQQQLLDDLNKQTATLQAQQAQSKLQEQKDTNSLIADAAMAPGVPSSLLTQAQNLPYAQAAALLAPYASIKAPGDVGLYAAYKSDTLSRGGNPMPFASYQNYLEQIKLSGKMSLTGGGGSGTSGAGGLSPAALDQAARSYLISGNLPTLGNGSKEAKAAIMNRAAELNGQVDLSSQKQIYSANNASIKTLQSKVNNVESISNAMTSNFDRLSNLITTLSDSKAYPYLHLGTNALTNEAKIYALAKQGDKTASNYLELVRTMQSDYGAIQASLAGSRGGQYFAETGEKAIPLGLTADQYTGIKDTINQSSENAKTAVSREISDTQDKQTHVINGSDPNGQVQQLADHDQARYNQNREAGPNRAGHTMVEINQMLQKVFPNIHYSTSDLNSFYEGTLDVDDKTGQIVKVK